MFKHCYIPQCMINSVIIPLIKNKCGDQTDKNNYKPIALSSIISKVFEHVIAERLEVYHWTNDNQFGFKSGHSTDLCLYALTDLIEYFKSRSTSVHVYVAFLDTSKAFDKISHWTLFRKLVDRCVPLYLVVSCQLGPRYKGQLTRMAEPIPPSGQSSSYSLTTLSSSSPTDRRAETDRKVITTRIAVAHHFKCRLRRRESCILGATSSQPTLPLHEVGHISGFLPPATLAVDNVRAPHYRRAPRKGCCSGGRSLRSLYAEFWARNH